MRIRRGRRVGWDMREAAYVVEERGDTWAV